MLVKIFKNDSGEEDPIAKLPEGEHLIGRGPLLICYDNRVSRKHGIIHVYKDSATITSTHDNPAFHLPVNSGLVVLEKSKPAELKNGDKFSLLADEFWFRVELSGDDKSTVLNNNMLNHSIKNEPLPKLEVKTETPAPDVEVKPEPSTSVNNAIKREREESSSDVTNDEKKPRISENVDNEEVSNTTTLKRELVSESEGEDDVKPSEVTPDANAACGSSSSKGDAGEPSKDGSGESSKPKKDYRDRCWYGSKCFRKNPAHRQHLSHPGDDDYDTDPEDDRQVCAFGAGCYRRNPTHRMTFRHLKTDGQGPRPKRKRTRKKATPGTQRTRDAGDSESDDYDLDDPFIDDATEDEYQPTSDDDSDSEWGDSQNVEEESEDTRRLLKEAKKFTKDTKKD